MTAANTEAERRSTWARNSRSGYHLDREFQARCDCAYGHYAVHFVGSSFRDQWDGRRRVHRSCFVDECQSLWSELAFTSDLVATGGGE